MATYKGIKGVKVQSLASDPPAAQSLGQVWYNTASNVLKYSIEGAGAWSSAPVTNNSYSQSGYLGTQTACLSSGGFVNGVTSSVISESYNGTAWSETNDLPAARYGPAGFGTTTAGVNCGGRTADNALQNSTDEWDGTNWTLVPGTLNTGRGSFHGTGVQTAGIVAGGVTPSNTSAAETYNGTTWTTVSSMLVVKTMTSIAGTQTAALMFGARPPDNGSASVEEYNGTSWSEENNINTARSEGGGSGTVTAAMLITGQNAPGETVTAVVEQWNGTSWTEVADVATARKAMPGSGTSGTTSASIIWGGFSSPTPPAITATEEWNDPVLSTKTVTVS
jgi:hypothetical protein